jgi:thioredoxin reductase
MNDVIIIGGSFAGLAAALQLGRARRKITSHRWTSWPRRGSS